VAGARHDFGQDLRVSGNTHSKVRWKYDQAIYRSVSGEVGVLESECGIADLTVHPTALLCDF
jgi:hypothetical protein